MISLDEGALICDLAETYHIYDYKKLPLTQVAIFAIGLKDDSRIKMKMSGKLVPTETLLLAGIADRLSVLLWRQTKDGQKGRNMPTMILDTLVARKNKESDVIVFSSGEDYKKTRNEILKNIQVGGE
jgi:hypothetical protein